MAKHPLPRVGSPLHPSKHSGLLLRDVLQPLLEIIPVQPEDPIPNSRNEPLALLRDDRRFFLCRLTFSSSVIRRHQARSLISEQGDRQRRNRLFSEWNEIAGGRNRSGPHDLPETCTVRQMKCEGREEEARNCRHENRLLLLRLPSYLRWCSFEFGGSTSQRRLARKLSRSLVRKGSFFPPSRGS